MTYSFPCTDLSAAGKRLGMEKGSGTRSGLLWEVERLLKELGNNIPQVLVMENVPQVITSNGWFEWCNFLETLGYKNYCEILNSKNFYIPQNRGRAFMVSILGNYVYNFPKHLELKYTLEDFLEKQVDEKYYLTDSKMESIRKWKAQQDPLKNIDKPKTICPTLTARGAGEEHSGMILINEKTLSSYTGTFRYSHSDKFIKKKDRFEKDTKVSCTITTKDNFGIVENKNKIRKLIPKEGFRLMGLIDEDIDKITVSNAQQYKQAGNSIVVSVLMAIFGKLLDIDYVNKIKDLYDMEVKKWNKAY